MKKVSFRNDVLPLKNELFRLALRITLNRAEAEDIVRTQADKGLESQIRVGKHRSIEHLASPYVETFRSTASKRRKQQ